MEDTEQCPFCGEEIKAIARICRYCHSDPKVDSQGQKWGTCYGKTGISRKDLLRRYLSAGIRFTGKRCH
jgi:hypothetical protein